MADNYLEKRMDDYRSGRISRVASSHRSSASLKYPRQTVLLLNVSGEMGRAVVKGFVDAGCLAVFTCANRMEGQSIAQACGGRFYPLCLDKIAEDMNKRGERIDAVVAFDCSPIIQGVEMPVGEHLRLVRIENEITAELENPTVISIIGNDPVQASILALTFAHPAITVVGQRVVM